MKQLPIALLLIALLLSACTSPSTRQTLDHAEAIIEDYPDSALYLLESIDGTKLSGEAQARHALLLSQAYDKNYIDITDDSLIAIAKDYYTLTDNDYYRMLAAYYYALVHANAGEYEIALAAALESEHLAKEQQHYLSLARADAMLSTIYSETYNNDKALEYALKNIEHSRLANKRQWIANGMTKLAQCYLTVGQYNRALEYIDSAKAHNGINEHETIHLSLLANAGKKDYVAIDSIFYVATTNNIPLNASALAYAAEAKYHLSDFVNYKTLIQQAESNAQTQQDSIEITAVKYDIALASHNMANALDEQNILLDFTGRLFMDATSHSIHLVQIEFEKEKARRIETLRETEELRSRFMLACLCLGILGLLFFIIYLRNRQKRIIANQQHRLELFIVEYNQLKRESLNQQKELTDAILISTRNELISRFRWIEKIGNIYLDATITQSGQKNTYKRLERTLQEVRETKFLASLESTIDFNRNNLISRLRTEYPKLTNSEINLILYTCTGLSTRIIAFILDKNENAVYAQKHRIKRKLALYYPELLEELSDIFT